MGLLFSGAFCRLLTLVHWCPWTTGWNHCSDTSPSNVKASGRIPVSSDPSRYAEGLLQCAEHMLLHGIVFGFSLDLSLGMCLQRQFRLAARLSLPRLSDLTLQISQNLGLLWGLQDPPIPPGAHLPFPEVGLGVSTHLNGGAPGLEEVTWQHQAPVVKHARHSLRWNLCLLDTSHQRGHCWVCPWT